MKSLKMMAACLLLMVSASAFAKTSSQQVKGNFFSTLRYGALTAINTSYTAHLAIQELGPDGSYYTGPGPYSGNAVDDYVAYLYITPTGTTDYTQRVTVPGPFTGTAQTNATLLDGSGGYNVLTVTLTIATGANYASYPFSQIDTNTGAPQFYNEQISVTSYDGYPIYIDPTTIYFTHF